MQVQDLDHAQFAIFDMFSRLLGGGSDAVPFVQFVIRNPATAAAVAEAAIHSDRENAMRILLDRLTSMSPKNKNTC
jgi:hypothetical protein